MYSELTLAQYWDELNKHDWYYAFSDDGLVYSRGSANEGRLKALAKQSPAHQQLFNDFYDHHFSGASWNTKKHPRPPRPEDLV